MSMIQNAKSDALLSWELLFMSARNYLKGAKPGRSLRIAGVGKPARFPADHGPCRKRGAAA
jgi:hypothetical protein